MLHTSKNKLIFATWVLALSANAHALVVDTDVDAPAALVGGEPTCAVKIGSETHCTLRAAIQVANFNGGSTVIELQRGRTYTLSAARDGEDASGDAGALTVGPSAFAAISVTVRAVGAGLELATISKSDAFDDSLFHVIGDSGILKLDGIRLLGNQAAPPVPKGGAVRCDHAGSVFSVNSAFVANSATVAGGALFLDDCGANLERTGFVANSAAVSGGAVAMRDGFIVASAASFASNVAQVGGAIDVMSQSGNSVLVAVNVTFHENAADVASVRTQNALVALHSVTSVQQVAQTFLDQDGGTLQIANTAIADSGGLGSIRLHGAAVFQSSGHNRLQQLNSDAPVALADTDALNFTDAQVSIQSAALWPGSVAIPIVGSPLIGQGGGEVIDNQGRSSPLCTDLDANLASRVAMHRCDIGAANFVDPIFESSFELPETGKANLFSRPARVPARRPR